MLTSLRLQNFRSFTDSTFELGRGVTIVAGPNASGKTNLLEALLVLARGASYRAKIDHLVNFDQPWARLDSHDNQGLKRTLKITREPDSGRQYEIDGKIYKRLSTDRALPVVLFEPNHLQMFSGGPERRRDYMDDLLEQTVLGYGSLRRQYKRALLQRNNLLKKPGSGGAAQLFPWDVRISQLGGQIARFRTELTGLINNRLSDLYGRLSRTDTRVEAVYDSGWPIDNYESLFLNSLAAGRETDRLRGFTGRGPHREDLVITFDSQAAQRSASRGEARTAVLALKVIELDLVEKARPGQTPLLLLDDVFSELDANRRQALTSHLRHYQTFITTTDADLVARHFGKPGKIIKLQ